MAWMERFNYLDFMLLAIVGASVLASVVRGFTRELAGLLALILGVLLGLWFHGAVAALLMDYVSSHEVARMAGFGVIFLGVVVIGGFIGSAASKVLQVTGLSLVDRLAGAAFGLLKGSLFCAVILFALLAFTPGGPPAAISSSVVAPYVMWSASVLSALAPADVKAAVAQNAELIRQTWDEHSPPFVAPEEGAANEQQVAPPKRPAGKTKPSPR
ncbi:MAG: CvpA family protein [Bryobacterales bacterium]|nr:CvpA family protein [Bryobacterales bacterium]